jgi:4-carboxymuconolactone decarboxylase
VQQHASEVRFKLLDGISVYATIFGLADQDMPAALADLVGPTFAEEAFQVAGGAAWWHPDLTPRDRSIAIITALVCQGVVEKRLRSHVRLGMRAGLDPNALMALMTLLASYVGFPRASIAIETIRDECGADSSNFPRESK